jgi:hypothetical protein
MTNKELCTKAVAAYHMANPNITVDEWECDPENEGVAILSIGGRKVYIRHDEENGFEMLKHYAAPAGHQEGNLQPVEVDIDDFIPEFIPWRNLDDGGTGALPVVLDLLAVICIIIGCILFFTVTMLWLAYVVGCFVGAVALHIVAAIIRSTRATQAHAAYIEALLVHIAEKK